MNQNYLQCIIVTPEKAVLDATADFVAVPMYDGELGVLPGRSPLIGRLGFGELRTKKGNDIKRYYVDGGFVQIRSDVVTVLTPRAMTEDKLSVDQAVSDLEAALQPGETPEAQDEQLQKQQRARAQLHMARRREQEI